MCKFYKSGKNIKLTETMKKNKKSYNIFCYLNKRKQIGLTKKNNLGFLQEYNLPIVKEKSNKNKFKNWNFFPRPNTNLCSQTVWQNPWYVVYKAPAGNVSYALYVLSVVD